VGSPSPDHNICYSRHDFDATSLASQRQLRSVLDKAETAGLVTDAEWKAYNKDHDGALELDEWLNIVRARFRAADSKKDGKLTAQELDSPAGQALLKLVVGQ
jgi:hypothetical protein